MMPLWAFGFIGLFMTSFVVVGLVAAGDLVGRPRAAPWWMWGVCVLPLGISFLSGAIFWSTWGHGHSGVVTATATMLLLGWSGALVGLAWSVLLSGIRLLRPEGDSRWNRRSWVPMGLCGVVWAVSGLFAIGSVDRAILWMPVSTYALGAGLCQVALGRRGTARLDSHRSMASAVLSGSAVLAWSTFSVAIGCMFGVGSERDDMGMYGLWIAVNAVLVGGFVASMLWAHGRQRLLPWGLAVGFPLLTAVPHLSWALFPPVVPGFAVPEWVDLTGTPGGPAPSEPDGPNTSGGVIAPYQWGPWRATHDANTPLTEIEGSASAVVVGDGRWTTRQPLYRSGRRHVVRRVGERVLLDERLVAWPLGLHAAVQDAAVNDVLEVVRSPDWTVQDFVSMCASFPGACTYDPD